MNRRKSMNRVQFIALCIRHGAVYENIKGDEYRLLFPNHKRYNGKSTTKQVGAVALNLARENGIPVDHGRKQEVVK